MSPNRFLVITPARNEEQYLGQTIASIVSQTVLPQEWIIVDDGSRDATAAIAQRAAGANPWIKVVRRRDRGYRDVGSGMVDAFYLGLNNVKEDNYDFIFIIDADVVLSRDYFKVILNKFSENPRLGIAGGTLYEPRHGKFCKTILMPWRTYGAAKCWRRTCFQDIGGLVKHIGWDNIDNFNAMMRGWETRVFEDEALKTYHLRPMGWSEKSPYTTWIRSGNALYFMGAHPLWVLASSVYHFQDYPYVIGGLCTILGYLQALLKGAKPYDDREFRNFLWKWQLKKLSELLGLH
ncbi:MAG: glycosyltransferase family 2 protein [Deltaproteobacteria bacterium]|nr:glycosyltransferase family 2 protein [Deltaproteobacteria bacterium]